MEESKKYSEMLAKAKLVHPDLKVRLNESTETWEFYMSTEIRENSALDESFKGTYAWNLFEESESAYGNSLERYRQKQGFSHLPLHAVAEKVNIDSDFTKAIKELAPTFYAEYGLTQEKINNLFSSWGDNRESSSEEEIEAANKIFNSYEKMITRVNAEVREKFKFAYDSWNSKWGH